MSIVVKNASTLKHDLSTGVNLFLGAGFSVGAKDLNGYDLPMGSKLQQEAVELYNLSKYSSLPLPKISRIIENSASSSDWNRYLTSRFTISKYETYYNNLNIINLNYIFTTNIDNLIFEIIEKSEQYYVNDMTINGPVQNDKRAVQYVPLHGCVLHPNKGYIFSDEGLSTAFSGDPDKWHILTGAVQRQPTVFIGYGMNDAGVLEALADQTMHGREKKNLWFLARNEESKIYFEAIGFNAILGETKDFLEWIEENIHHSEETIDKSNINYSGLEKERLPDVNRVPNVGKPDFYLGGEPHWCYIYSNSLYELACGEKILERIYDTSYKNQIIVGMAFSGKTTLLMQLANKVQYSGLKLVAQSLSIDYSQYIIKKVNGRKAILFVDDFTEDTYAYKLLAEQDNIKVIGFTRDYSFELVAHLINPTDKSNIIDMTELTKEDFGHIYRKISDNLRKETIDIPKDDCTVFEFVQNNIRSKRTKEKLVVLYKDLKKTNSILLDCILACSYVNDCGTPISFDMLIAFLRDRVDDYKQIYRLMEKIKNMIKDYELVYSSLEELPINQDYYHARSRVFSSSFLQIASSIDLKNMLTAFTMNVSPLRIYEYKTFKRRGYDAKLFAKAFPNADEGKTIYERLLILDDTAYMKQQYAIYLSRVKDYPNAFRIIDDARSMAHKNIFSINNTYAMILYESNKDLSIENNKVKNSLCESLNMLIACYENDQRKSFHAIRFGQYAIDFYSKYPDDEQSIEYLHKAQGWAVDELKKSSWSYELKSVKKDLDRLLDTH